MRPLQARGQWSRRDRAHALCAFIVPCALVVLGHLWLTDDTRVGREESGACQDLSGYAIGGELSQDTDFLRCLHHKGARAR